MSPLKTRRFTLLPRRAATLQKLLPWAVTIWWREAPGIILEGSKLLCSPKKTRILQTLMLNQVDGRLLAIFLKALRFSILPWMGASVKIFLVRVLLWIRVRLLAPILLMKVVFLRDMWWSIRSLSVLPRRRASLRDMWLLAGRWWKCYFGCCREQEC